MILYPCLTAGCLKFFRSNKWFDTNGFCLDCYLVLPSTHTKKLCSDNRCKECYYKTFVSSESVFMWDDTRSPRTIIKSLNRKFAFKCPTCLHSFQLNISKPYSCSYCNNEELCGQCPTCINKSFAASSKARYWSSKNKKTADMIFSKNNLTKYWFNCGRHDFRSTIPKIEAGKWCRLCKNKTEGKIKDFLSSIYTDITHQFKAGWSKNPLTNRHWSYDFCVGKVLIEVDGDQHFKNVRKFRSKVADVLANDIHKAKLALTNGYSLIRITQADVWNERYKNWKTDLINIINKSKDSKKPRVYYLSSTIIKYKKHQETT